MKKKTRLKYAKMPILDHPYSLLQQTQKKALAKRVLKRNQKRNNKKERLELDEQKTKNYRASGDWIRGAQTAGNLSQPGASTGR